MNKLSKTPGICRIDQPEKRNHGFFVRLQRGGKIYSAFFTDFKHGGRKQALTAAQGFYHELQTKIGPPPQKLRRWWADLPRRNKGTSGIVGVQRVMNWQTWPIRTYWQATWSPEPYVARRKMFSIRKHGEERARQLAIRARRAGLRSMVD